MELSPPVEPAKPRWEVRDAGGVPVPYVARPLLDGVQCIVHTYDYGECGFADFLRSAWALYAWCRECRVDYVLHIFGGHPLGKYLRVGNIRSAKIVRQESSILTQVDMTDDPGRILHLLLMAQICRHGGGVQSFRYVIRTNHYRFVPRTVMERYRTDFLAEIMKCEALCTLVAPLHSMPPITSIHVRCGDRHMHPESTNHFIEPQRAMDIVSKVLCTVRGEWRVFSDSVEVQRVFSKTADFPVRIRHTSSTTTTEEDVRGMLLDFFSIGIRSSVVISLVRSGFPYWAARLYEKPIFVMMDAY